MNDDKQFEVMVEACLKVHEAVVESGTSEMLALSRLLLFQIGRECVQREARPRDVRDGI